MTLLFYNDKKQRSCYVDKDCTTTLELKPWEQSEPVKHSFVSFTEATDKLQEKGYKLIQIIHQ